MKIILVGMPGSGKSTVGKELSLHLKLPFIDLDAEIEKTEGKKINDIFRESNEDYFREVESLTLKKIILSNEKFILATGGGAPCFHDGISIINQNGLSIFLDVTIDELVARVETDKNRPLLLAGDKEELRNRLTNLRMKRIPCYRQASIIVAGSDIHTVIQALDSKI